MYKKLITVGSFFGIFIFIMNILANLFYWYTSIFWFDMFMHTLGGVFIAIVFGAIFQNKFSTFSSQKFFLFLISLVFVIGVFWEGYEYVVQYFIKNVHLADLPDSISDLVCDVVGGSLGALFVITSKRSYNITDAKS